MNAIFRVERVTRWDRIKGAIMMFVWRIRKAFTRPTKPYIVWRIRKAFTRPTKPYIVWRIRKTFTRTTKPYIMRVK